MATTTCPVLRPTAEEFADFEAYVAGIDDLLVEHGVVKVVPPDGWHPSEYNWREWGLRLTAPIRQLASGRAGVYHVDIVEGRSMSLEEFEAKANKQPCDEDTYEKVERKFWKSLGIASVGEPPMYGADMMGSAFSDDCTSTWNLKNLPTILKLLGNDLPGVTNPMLYAGMWRAMFAFHVEDMDLYSINYVHFGAPKSWYSIPEEYAERFETLANSYFPELYKDCKEYLRHKVVMISPSKLKEHGIPYRTVVQEAGEFVITSPKAYHAGYNHGFNLAEATNFATERWIPYGRTARVCKCRPFCVSIDMDFFETKYRRMQRQRTGTAAISSVSRSQAETDSLDNGSTDRETEPQWQVEGWEFSCTCGLRCSDEDHPSKHPIGEQFECAACGIWCHVTCVYGEQRTAEELPEGARCAICMVIDDMEGVATHSSKEYRMSNASDAATRPSRKRPRRAPKAALQKGREVYLQFIDGSWEQGTVVTIEDGAAKVVLQRPRRGRDKEQWVSLQSGSLVLAEDFEAGEGRGQVLGRVDTQQATSQPTAASNRAARANRRRRLAEEKPILSKVEEPVGSAPVAVAVAVAAASTTPPGAVGAPTQPSSFGAPSTFTSQPSDTGEAQNEDTALLKLLCRALADSSQGNQTSGAQPPLNLSLAALDPTLLQHPDVIRNLTAMLLEIQGPSPTSWGPTFGRFS